MKKLCAYFLLILILLSWSFALAETTTAFSIGYTTYTNDYFNYKVDYPVGWLVMDSETINDQIQRIANGDIEVDAFTAEGIVMMEVELSAATDGYIVEFADWIGNSFNITCFEFPTRASIELTKSVFAPQIIREYSIMIEGLEVLDSGSIYELDGRSFLHIQYHYLVNGKPLTMTTLYYFENGMGYNICFFWSTSSGEYFEMLQQIMEHVLASFTLI